MVASSLTALGMAALKSLLLEVFQRKGNSFIDKIDIDIRFQNIDREILGYVNGYVSRHARIKVLNMRDSVHLEDIYTDSELLLSKQDPSSFDSLEELEEKYQEVGDMLSINRHNQERASAIEFIKNNSRTVVLGGPGAGKTTLLKKIGIEVFKWSDSFSSKKKMMPVFLELKDLATIHEIDLKEEITKEVRTCGFKQNAETIIDILLEQGRLLIVFDGLDELPKEKRIRAIDLIQDFSDEYHGNHFLVSCRLAAYQYKRLQNFRDVELASFNNDQTKDAILKWFGDDASSGIDCWQRLSALKNSEIKKLANTPLLLTMICIHYKQTGRFPVNRTTLYEKALSIILEEWNASKGFIPDRYVGLELRQKEILLETIAYESFQEGQLFMYARWMGRRIEEMLDDMDTNLNDTGKRVIEAMEVDHGIFVRQGEQIYSFSHATIQEFLVAEYAAKKNFRIKELVKEKITDERWRDIFIFASGFRQSDDILDELEEKTYDYINGHPSVTRLLAWISRSTTMPGSSNAPIARRLLALHVFLCMCLYTANTERLFKSILKAVRMCQFLLSTFEQSIPKKLRRDLLQFERLIAMLIAARKSVSGYLYATEVMTGAYGKVGDMRKHIMALVRHVDTSMGIFESKQVFVNSNKLAVAKRCRQVGIDALSQNMSSLTVLGACSEIFVECMKEIGINISLIDDIRSSALEDLTNYLYCISLLKDCSDTAKLFSKSRWAEIEKRMLFTRWV